MTARKPSSSNLRKWTCTMLVAMLATTPIYPPSSGAESGVREEPRPAAAPADRTIPLSGPGARPSVCQVPSVPGPDRSELPVIGESLPGSWRRDLKYQKPRRLAPGESGGTYISPQGPGPVHPEGRWLPGYRPVTAEASQAYRAWKKEEANRVRLSESSGALPRTPAEGHNRSDTYLTDPYMLAPEEAPEGSNWRVREQSVPVYTVNLLAVPAPDADARSGEKPYKSSYLRSGLTGDEYRALKLAAEDTPETVDAQDAGATHAPTLLTGSSFDAIFAQGGVPPDPIVAVGPNHIVAMVNSRVSIYTYDPTGSATLVQSFDVDSFFAQAPAVPNCSGTFDPFVDYDEALDRFVIGMDSLVGASPESYYCIAATATNDPTGSWHRTSFRTDATNTGTWSDFPHMGIGLEAVYIVGNMFVDGGGFLESRGFAVNKNDLYAGNPVQIAEDTFSFFTVQPVKIHGFSSGGWPAPGTPHYFISHNGSQVRIYGWSDPFNSGAFVAGNVNYVWNGAPPNADDGGTRPNDTGSGDFLDAEFRDNKIYATRSVACNIGGGGAEACLDWVVVDVTGGIPVFSAQQTGGAFGSADVDRYMPDITVDRNGNIVLGYSRTTPSTFNELYVTGRLFGDPVGQLQTEALQRTSAGQYEDGVGCGNGSCDRWGDYSGVAVAPDGCTVVHLGETSDDLGVGVWNTNIGIWKFDDCSPDSSVRVDKGTYTCDDTLEVTVSDNTAIDAATVSAQTTITSGPDSETIPSGNWVGTDCAGLDCGSWTATIPVSGNVGAVGDGTVNVIDGNTIVVTYVDPHVTHDNQTRSVTVDCQTGLDDGGFLIEGGCENGTGTEFHRDYIDAGELISYTFGLFNPSTGADLTDVEVTLSITGAASTDITIYNPTIHIGAVAAGSLSGGSFQLEVAGTATAHPLTTHDFDLSITSVADGKTIPQVLTQQVVVQGDDVITNHSHCYDFESGTQGWQNERYVANTGGANTVVAPWTRGGGCGSETRTDGNACNAGGTNAFKTNPNAGSCGNFPQSPVSVMDDINYSPILQPALTGNGPSGEPYNFQWTSVEYYYRSDMEVTAGGDIAAATGQFFSTDYQGVSNPAENEIDTEYNFFTGYFFLPNSSFNDPAAFDPDNPPQNYLPISFSTAASGLATPGLNWRMAIEVFDADWGSDPTTTAATPGLSIDNVVLLYDEYYAEGQAGVCSGAAGVVALDQFTYQNCPADTVGLSVLDGDAGGSVSVTVTADNSGDSETIVINAAGPHYAVDVPYSTTEGAAVDDGILNVTPNDIIRASYADISAAETVEASASLTCPSGDIIIEQVVQISDNGDSDNFPDTNETVNVSVRLANNGSIDLTNVQVMLYSDDPNIECIQADTVNFGSVAAGTTATNDIVSAPFTFKVAHSAECVDPDNPPTASFRAFIVANEISGSAQPQGLTFPLDLNRTGSVLTFNENFNAGQGAFTHKVGEGDLNGAAADPNNFACGPYIDEWFYGASGGSTLSGTPGGGMFLWTDPADSFPNGSYTGGQVVDGEVSMNDAVLLSPTFTIDAPSTTLTFDHEYQFGALSNLRADGGVVNYRVNGGAWQKLTIPSYDGNLITNYYCNPLCNGGPFGNAPDACDSENGSTGENVFCALDAQGTGDLVNWNTASGTVSGLTPEDQVQFRWRFGSMHSVQYGISTDGGWGIDNVNITNVAELECDAAVNPDSGCGVVFNGAGNLTEICGDADANVEPTEIWSVDVTLKNAGASDAVATVADLALNVGSVTAATITGGNPGTYGTIAAGGTASATYSFEVDSGADCSSDLKFDVVNIADNAQSYPSRLNAISIGTGGPGQMETAVQASDPLDATSDSATSTLTAPFTLSAPVTTGSLGYGFGYTNGTPSETANPTTNPVQATNGETVTTMLPAFTIADVDATLATVDWASLTYGGDVDRCTRVFLRTPNATDVTLKPLATPAANPYDVLGTYQSVNGGAGTYSIGLEERQGGGCNGTAALSNASMTVDGTPTAGSWNANVQVSLWDGSTETTLKAFGAADANPYDVTSLYTGPGTYELRIQENGGGGTATASGGSMTIFLAECDQGCACAGPGDPQGLLVGRSGGDVVLTFDGSGAPGATWNVYRDTNPEPGTWGAAIATGVTDQDLGTPGIQYIDVGVATDANTYYYKITESTGCGGESPL